MITLLWTILFCLGWRIITDEGQILYFIRKPFEDINSEYDKEKIELAYRFDKSLVPSLKWKALKHKLMETFGKPFVLCITCFASIWGVTVFVALNGLNKDLIVPLILNCVSASFIQTAIWKAYVKYLP